MRLFNSFQLVAAYVAWPFGIQMLADASFRGSAGALFAACAGYVVATGFMVAAVYMATEKER